MSCKTGVKTESFWYRESVTKVVPVLPRRKEAESSSQWNLLSLDRCGVWCSSRVLAWPNFVFNDMPRVVENAKLAMFADDSKCFKAIYQESDFVNLQRDLDALFTWSVSNEIFSQPTKCVNLRISRKRNSPSSNYSLNGISLEVVKAKKNFGVLISSDMT